MVRDRVLPGVNALRPTWVVSKDFLPGSNLIANSRPRKKKELLSPNVFIRKPSAMVFTLGLHRK